MANQTLRERAQLLRKRGKSIRDIAQTLPAPKSTVSMWCKDIVLTQKQRAVLFRNQQSAAVKALLKASEEKRRQRLERDSMYAEQGASEVGSVRKRDIYLLGLGLYWAEGYRKNTREFGFTNSDTAIIRTSLRWLRDCYGIKTSDLTLRVTLNHVHKKREREVLAYWRHITGTSAQQFTKTSFIQTSAKKVYANPEAHFGTLRVKVRRSTALLQRILGSLRHLQKLS